VLNEVRSYKGGEGSGQLVNWQDCLTFPFCAVLKKRKEIINLWVFIKEGEKSMPMSAQKLQMCSL
jgi:hypothetical protein